MTNPQCDIKPDNDLRLMLMYFKITLDSSLPSENY